MPCNYAQREEIPSEYNLLLLRVFCNYVRWYANGINLLREQIEEKLRTAFDPVFLEVVDESYRHNVPAGSESHFKVVLVSDRFTGERFLNRHRMIYGTLTAELSTTVHALALHTYTLKEWEGLQDTIFASPPCRGAGSIA